MFCCILPTENKHKQQVTRYFSQADFLELKPLAQAKMPFIVLDFLLHFCIKTKVEAYKNHGNRNNKALLARLGSCFSATQ